MGTGSFHARMMGALGLCFLVGGSASAWDSPYVLPAGTAPVQIYYQFERDGRGIIHAVNARVVSPQQVEIALSPHLALGPSRLKVHVLTALPGYQKWQPIATFLDVRGKQGRYVIGREALQTMARNFLKLMNRVDQSFSIRHLVPAINVSLLVVGDDAQVNSVPVMMTNALVLQPDLVNDPDYVSETESASAPERPKPYVSRPGLQLHRAPCPRAS